MRDTVGRLESDGDQSGDVKGAPNCVVCSRNYCSLFVVLLRSLNFLLTPSVVKDLHSPGDLQGIIESSGAIHVQLHHSPVQLIPFKSNPEKPIPPARIPFMSTLIECAGGDGFVRG